MRLDTKEDLLGAIIQSYSQPQVNCKALLAIAEQAWKEGRRETACYLADLAHEILDGLSNAAADDNPV